MRRVLDLLAHRMMQQRANDTDQLRGVAIDQSEAESIVEELRQRLAEPLEDAAPAPRLVDRAPSREETPLDRVRRVFDLQQTHVDALILCVAVELDSRFARLVAYLNDHFSRSRPTVGLVLAMSNGQMTAADFCECDAVRHGLLQIEGDAPLSESSLRVPREFLTRLVVTTVVPPIAPGVRLHTDAPLALDALPLTAAQRGTLRKWASSIGAAATPPPLLLTGLPGAGRATAARAASALGGRAMVECAWMTDRADLIAIAVREARWFESSLLIRMADAATAASVAGMWTALANVNLPIAVALPPEHAAAACASASLEPLVVDLGPLAIGQREALWAALLSPPACGVPVTVSDAERRELAERYDFLPGTLVRAVRRAVADRPTDDALDFASLASACRTVGSAVMGTIAQRLPQPYTRTDLVLPRPLLDELDLAAAWAGNGRRVFEEWGFGRRVAFGRGLTALFTGEPGTGKTMTAQVLSAELALDLFRVDLSRVMSKYIGETEKNLSRLFEDAKASGAILFFDEADALFGKRTEVKDAHDRYANVEIGYLLQRMEEHTGITILATNRAGDLDKAFTRRFHFILDFPMPRAPDRRRIWEGMLPPGAAVDADIDLDQLAREYEISGGEIRNSVLSAAFIAAQEGVPIGLRHLKRGLRRELLKTGRVLDARQRRQLDGD